MGKTRRFSMKLKVFIIKKGTTNMQSHLTKIKLAIFLVLTVSWVFLITKANTKESKKDNDKLLVNLDFQNADIKDVIKSISEMTGINFVFDDKVRGKISIISPTKVTIKEAYKMFLSAMKLKGYLVVPITKKIAKIIPERDGPGSSIIVSD